MIAQTVTNQTEERNRYTPDEYLELEVHSETRHEYIDGEIIPMTGGMPNHNKIAGNVYAAMNYAFRGKPLQAFFTDQRLWISRKRIYTYPDVMVVEGELQLQEGRRDVITNPLLIVEVLSESTAAYDRTGKFAAYRTIPSFQEYLLIDQYSQQIEHYTKISARKWEFQAYDETDSIIELQAIALQIPLINIYDKVEFETESEPTASPES